MYDLLAHPEDWADHVMIIPEKEPDICMKCLNKKMNECLGKNKCPLIKRKLNEKTK